MVDPNPITGVLRKRRKFRDSDTLRECHMRTKAEIEVICLQAKQHQGFLTTT